MKNPFPLRLLMVLVFLLSPVYSKADQQVLVHCAVYQDGIVFDQPTLMTMERVKTLARAVPEQAENFIGFTDAEGTIFQFFVDAPGKIWAEIPSVAEQGSYGRQVTEAEYLELISELQEPYNHYRSSLGLKFQSW